MMLNVLEAAQHPIRDLSRQLAAGLPHGALPRFQRTIASMFVEVLLGDLGQQPMPSLFEVSVGIVEGPGAAVSTHAATRCRIETTRPCPSINAAHASMQPDRANVGVAVMDQPRLLLGVWIAAAG